MIHRGPFTDELVEIPNKHFFQLYIVYFYETVLRAKQKNQLVLLAWFEELILYIKLKLVHRMVERLQNDISMVKHSGSFR